MPPKPKAPSESKPEVAKPKPAPPAAPAEDAAEIYSARLSELEDRIAKMESALRSQLNISDI